MFVRELLYQLDMMRYYGLGNFGGVASAFLCVLVCAFFFYQGAKIIISRAHRKSKKELKHPNGLYGMPIEICTAIYFVAEMFLLCMSISLGEYAYIGMLGAAVLMHFCENIVQRKDRGLLTRGSLYEKVHTAAQKAGIVHSIYGGMQHCQCVIVPLYRHFNCKWTWRCFLLGDNGIHLSSFSLWGACHFDSMRILVSLLVFQ